MDDAVIFVPLLVAVYHPKKLLFVFVGVGNVPYVDAYITDLLDGDTEPPFASNVTVYVLALQLAVIVIVAPLVAVTQVQSLGGEYPPEKEMATHSSILS